MPNSLGFFDLFSDLDTISAVELASLSNIKDHHLLENHLGNRIIYPQTVASTKQELDLDFLIFGIAVKKHPELFFDNNQNRIMIPSNILRYLPPLTRLISVLLSNLPDSGISEIWLQEGDSQKVIASAIAKPHFDKMQNPGETNIIVEGKSRILIPNQLNLIPLTEKQVKIGFSSGSETTVLGSELGLFIDLRERNT